MVANNNKVWTIKEVLFWTSDYFKKNGIESPKFNAEMILSKILDLSRVNLYLHYDDVLSTDKLATIKKYIKKRSEHYPLQYLLGETEFYGHKIMVEEGVLIPRPETEILVDSVVTYISGHKKNSWDILELGTGTAVIPISIINYFKNQKYTVNFMATDISPKALEISQRNLAKYDLDNIKLIKSDMFENINNKFDIIISNPPYIEAENWTNLPPEIKEHEPKEALLAGEKGLEYYKLILEQAKNYLKLNSRIFLEIGAEQREDIINLVQNFEHEIIKITKDFNDRDRVVEIKVKE